MQIAKYPPKFLRKCCTTGRPRNLVSQQNQASHHHLVVDPWWWDRKAFTSAPLANFKPSQQVSWCPSKLVGGWIHCSTIRPYRMTKEHSKRRPTKESNELDWVNNGDDDRRRRSATKARDLHAFDYRSYWLIAYGTVPVRTHVLCGFVLSFPPKHDLTPFFVCRFLTTTCRISK